MNVKLDRISVDKNTIYYEYSYDEDLSRFFNKTTAFFIEYPSKEDFTNVPESILAVPFVMNFMPLIWMTNSELNISSLDKSFYNSIPDILAGLRRVYPDVQFGGQLVVDRIIDNSVPTDGHPVILFSGGVDAMSVLASHYSESPILVNVWGADIGLDDVENHDVIEKELSSLSKSLGVDYFYIKSSLRFCFVEYELHRNFAPILKDYWWHGIQHSIGLLSLLAPFDYLNHVPVNYIASSFTEKQVGHVRCVNYPFIDDCVSIASTKSKEDGFEYRRIDKINNIVDFSEKQGVKLNLKVCFHPVFGQNCCVCEKCLRTIAIIIACGGTPSQYGFEVSEKEALLRIKRYVDKNILSEGALADWLGLQEYVLSNHCSEQKVKWLATYKFNNYKPSLVTRGFHFLKRVFLKGK